MEKRKGQPDPNLKNVFEILERLLKPGGVTPDGRPPATIGADGLVDDLRSQADEFGRLYGIRVELSSNGTEDQLSPPQREVVAQVVREALTNVRRHSGSSICRVKTAFDARPFLVEVSDEGRGIITRESAGYGLAGSRERHGA